MCACVCASEKTAAIAAVGDAGVQVVKKYLRPGYMYVDMVGNTNTKTAKDLRHLAMCVHWEHRAATMGDVLKVYTRQHPPWSCCSP